MAFLKTVLIVAGLVALALAIAPSDSTPTVSNPRPIGVKEALVCSAWGYPDGHPRRADCGRQAERFDGVLGNTSGSNVAQIGTFCIQQRRVDLFSQAMMDCGREMIRLGDAMNTWTGRR